MTDKITLSDLQAAHVERQEEWCPDQKPDLSFRGNEMAGEVGEACNVIKKLERERHGWRGSRATKEQLAEELADVIHTAVLCAITAGIDLEPAVIDKFNSTSEKNGLASRIRSCLLDKPEAVEGDGIRDALIARLRQLHDEQHSILGQMLLDKSEEGQSAPNWQGGKVNGIASAISALSTTADTDAAQSEALIERLAKAVKDHPENSALGSTVRQIFALAAKEYQP
ncbi:MazG-like family protein [Sinorhizobium medicae]